MKNYFVFEMKDSFKIDIVTIFFMFFSIIFLFFSLKANENYESNYILNNYYFDEAMLERNIEVIQKDPEVSQKFIMDEKERGKNSIDTYSELKEDNWSSYLVNENNDLYFMNFTNEKNSPLFLDNHQNYVIGKTMFNQYLIENNLPQISSRYGTKSHMFVYITLSYLLTPIGLSLTLFLLSLNQFKKFLTGKINFIITNPISTLKILFCDLCVFVCKNFMFLMAIVTFAFIFSSLFSGGMSPSYPIVKSNGSIFLSPIVYENIKMCLFFILVISFCYFLCQTLVMLFRKVYVSFFICTILLVLGGSVSSMKLIATNPLSSFLPSTYLTFSKITTGRSFEDIDFYYQNYSNQDDKFEENKAIVENTDYYSGKSLTYQNSKTTVATGIFTVTFFSLLLFFNNVLLLDRRRLGT